MTITDCFTEDVLESIDKMIDMMEKFYCLKLPDKQEEATS